MKRFLNFCAMFLFWISAQCQIPLTVNEKMFVGFQRDDGVFVIYDAKGTVTVKDGFALRLETSELKLSKFLAVTDFYETLDGARAKLGLPAITDHLKIEKHDYLLLNGSDDWKRYCPIEIAETYIYKNEPLEYFNYYHPTHSILMLQDLANKGLQAKCNLKIEGLTTGIVYVETVQKQGAIRDDMQGINRFGNNHPMNAYGVGLQHDCTVKLPKNEILKFTWVNVGDTNIEVWLHHPDPAPNHLDFRDCISPGQVRSFEFNPGHYANLPFHKQQLKGNLNAEFNCNRQ